MEQKFFRTILLVCLIFYSIGMAGNGISREPSVKSDCYIYVSVNKEKKIVIFKLDPLKEELIFTGENSLAGEPGSLCTDPSGRKIYAALRDIACVATLNIDKKSGKLIHREDTPVAGNPVYISTDNRGKFLFYTSYSGNKNAVYRLEGEGVNKDQVQIIDANMNPHMIKSDASGKYVFVPNKGADLVQQFIFQANGILKPNIPEMISVKSGSGPRHFTFNPAGDIMYVVNEISCTIVAFHFDKKNGTLSGPFQEITTKPADFILDNTCADIHISPDGRFLYASNRGHDSLAGYSVDKSSGKLSPIGWFATEKEPREFEIDPSGKFVIAAGESSGRIALYRIQDDGFLILLKTYSTGQWPVWVKAVVFKNR